MSSGSGGVSDLTTKQRRAESGPALLPLGWRAYRRPHWWFEVVVLIVLDVVYEHLRNLVPTREAEALARGWDLFDFEQSIGLDIELTMNHFVMRHEWLAQIANYDYSFFHLPITGAVLIWLFWMHRRIYKTARTVLVFTTVLGLIGFWLFPMAPPRLLEGSGFTDTVVYFKTFGSWGSPAVADHSNLYAAMPSLHCAWAMWVGLSVFFVARHKLIRIIGLSYGIWTVFVVMATANHFIFDAFAGYACLAVSVLAVWLLFGHNPWSPALDKEELLRASRSGDDAIVDTAAGSTPDAGDDKARTTSSV
ncbi:inositol phosphorylceramide synthase [Flexivirga endophytica]|uniref:Inositol phosphorylceramide synthase n=1 Tax=Flexivirga endophytica TaxID=1849103 RepID=A0A916T286_9MICO|nr:phosphatase PAP2 family protein [Flexivirga endophytica]GGB25283.1 inositol phosphorylceramide synthase [Flexivirga endophytica]GHB53857.1 inositol phosphorylceramide synthase [Flexivirga endophytica]